MRSIIITFVFLFIITGLQAQQVLLIRNNTQCDLMVQTYAVESNTCVNNGLYQNNYVTSGTSMIVGAPLGEEWIYAEINGLPFCSGGVGIAIGTPMNCNSTCTWGVTSNTVEINNGCNGCLTNVAVAWSDCTAIGGELRISDF